MSDLTVGAMRAGLPVRERAGRTAWITRPAFERVCVLSLPELTHGACLGPWMVRSSPTYRGGQRSTRITVAATSLVLHRG